MSRTEGGGDTRPSPIASEMVEALLDRAEQGLHVAMVASCDCNCEANISPKPEAHAEACRYAVLYAAADALSDARAVLSTLEQPNTGVEEAFAPFIEAAKLGVATYEAVRAANLKRSGLATYETVYVSAGVHAAQSRISYANWAALASLAPPTAPAVGDGE